MSREKQIEEAAAYFKTGSHTISKDEWFSCGARWADANPAPLTADVEKLRDELARDYTGDHFHPTAIAARLGYESGFDACAEKLYKPLKTAFEAKEAIKKGSIQALVTISDELDEQRKLTREANERIAALEALAKQVATAAKNVMWINKCRCDEAYTARGKHQPNAMCGELDELEQALQAYEREMK